ncbi:hypothetical protein E4U54_007132, partial [Claviceps lovelessii]
QDKTQASSTLASRAPQQSKPKRAHGAGFPPTNKELDAMQQNMPSSQDLIRVRLSAEPRTALAPK